MDYKAVAIKAHITQEHLTLSTLGKIFSRQHFEIFFSYFFQKTGFDISCKLSPEETICMKCQILFTGKNKKNIINLSSAENAQRVVKVKGTSIITPLLAKIRQLFNVFFIAQDTNNLFVPRFYGPVNPMGSCQAWSLYLTTLLLGRLSPLSPLNQYCAHSSARN